MVRNFLSFIGWLVLVAGVVVSLGVVTKIAVKCFQIGWHLIN